MSGEGLDLTSVTMLIASGLTLTFVALSLVFGGFFAERRLRDRLEDIETRARTGSRPLQMATLRRVDKAGRLPTLDKLLWRWFPNASKIRQKLQTSGTNLTLGDYSSSRSRSPSRWPSCSTWCSNWRRSSWWAAHC